MTNFFLSSAVPNSLWERILDVRTVMPADIIAFSYSNPADHDDSTGHVVFVYGTPQTEIGQTNVVSFYVFDSSSSKHNDDTRDSCCTSPCTGSTCGVGIGKMYFQHDSNGAILAGWWRTCCSPTGTIDGVSAFSIARVKEFPSTSCYQLPTWATFSCSGCDSTQQTLMNQLNGVGPRVTQWSSSKTAWSGSSCVCKGSSCPAPSSCTSFSVTCDPTQSCDTFALNNPGFVRYILSKGVGKTIFPTPTANQDDWLEVIGSATGSGSTPNSTNMHNFFTTLATTNAYYFKKISLLSSVMPGDIISYNYATTSSSNAHVMFVLSKTEISSNVYEVKVMDSAMEGHCQDTRRDCTNKLCGVGWGIVYFETAAADGSVAKYYWADRNWTPFPYTSITFTRVLGPNFSTPKNLN